MSIKAIAFDFDGVLIESADIKLNAFRALFQEVAEPDRTRIADFLGANPGLSRFAKFAHIHETILCRPFGQADADALARRFSGLVLEAVIACPAVPGAETFVKQRAAEMPLAIVSATPEEELSVIVQRRALGSYFRHVMGTPCSKADNLGRFLAAHRLQPTDALMVGDTLADLNAAAACGVRFVGRTTAPHANLFPQDVMTVSDLQELSARWPVQPRVPDAVEIS